MKDKNYKVDPEKEARLREYLSTSGLKWKETQTSYIFDCPNCGKKDKLSMYKDNGNFVCYYCAEIDGFKGRVEFALAALLNISVKKVRSDLFGDEKRTAGLDFSPIQPWWDEEWATEEPPNFLEMPERIWGPNAYPIDHQHARAGAEYLLGRGIDTELAGYYGIRYDPVAREVLFPVQYGGTLFGWQGRRIYNLEYEDETTGETKTVPKVITTPGLKKDRIVMFADQLAGSDQAIICEGPVDAIKCDACHPPGEPAGNVATMGKAVSQAQINLIRYSGVSRVYLALDPDAVLETKRLIDAFDGYVETYLMEPPLPFGDFGEMSLKQVVEVYLTAPRVYPGSQDLYWHLNLDLSKVLRKPRRRYS